MPKRAIVLETEQKGYGEVSRGHTSESKGPNHLTTRSRLWSSNCHGAVERETVRSVSHAYSGESRTGAGRCRGTANDNGAETRTSLEYNNTSHGTGDRKVEPEHCLQTRCGQQRSRRDRRNGCRQIEGMACAQRTGG